MEKRYDELSGHSVVYTYSSEYNRIKTNKNDYSAIFVGLYYWIAH